MAFAKRSPKLPPNGGVSLERIIFGHFMSAKNPAGIAITLVKVDDEMLKFWDAPVRTPALETTG